MELHGRGKRKVLNKFDGGRISSDGGSILLREVELRTHTLKRLSQCFTNYRNPELVEHALESLIKQRVFGVDRVYEDLNDHEKLRQDACPKERIISMAWA